MSTEMFSVYDSAADRFIDPFPASTLEVALRGFREACEEPGHQFMKFPEDYALYHVGTFDAQLGELQGMKARKVAMASSYVGSDVDLMRAADIKEVS